MKNVIHLGLRKVTFGVKRTEIGEKSRKIGKSYFLYDFLFFNECYRMQYVQYRALFDLSDIIVDRGCEPLHFGAKHGKIEVKSRKIGKSHSLYSFLSK